MPELPSGTVTFLFTDIEGSTRLLKALGDRYGEALAEHQAIVRQAVAEAGGHEIDTQGDAFFIAFRRAKDAVATALTSQSALSRHPWPDGESVRVRMGIHTAEPAVGEERYVGLGVHRAARICAAGHGGQILLSGATRELVEEELPPGVELLDLGEHRLKDLDRPEHIFQLVGNGLGAAFPPLKTDASGPGTEAPFAGRERELAEAAHVAVRRRPTLSRRGLLLAALIAAAAVIASLAFLLTRGSGSPSLSSVPPNSVGVIDPASTKIVDAIKVGKSPGSLVTAGGDVFVANRNTSTVSEISVRSHEVLDTVGIGLSISDIAVRGGGVWVSDALGTLVVYNPVFGYIRTNVAEGDQAVGTGIALSLAGNTLWVLNASPPSLVKIDTQAYSELIKGRIALQGTPTALAAGDDFVWVGSADGTLSLVDLVTQGTQSVNIGDRVTAIALGSNAVWAVTSDGRAVRVDGDLRKRATIKVGKLPTGVAVGAGGVWVANSLSGTVSRIDPRTNRVTDTITVGNRPQDVVTAGGMVWVSVRD
jgi:YVTN family beta-propeller protein